MVARITSLLLILVVSLGGTAAGEGPGGGPIDLSGSVGGTGLAMPESRLPVHRIQLTARVDAEGAGAGTLILDPTPPAVDEFGFPVAADQLSPVKLDCRITLVKKKSVLVGPAGLPPKGVEMRLYSITGPKITGTITAATESDRPWDHARLLVADPKSRQTIAVGLQKPPLALPCHPGCFPAGTPVAVPGGVRAIDTLREGDVVTTVAPDGTASSAVVTGMSVTPNRLLEVRTRGKSLLTTETQPLSLESGRLRGAGELEAGDRILIWSDGRRAAVEVVEVTVREQRVDVYNLILKEPALFVADGFLARSKPPAPRSDIAVP